MSHDADPVPASALTAMVSPAIKVSFSKLDLSNINNPEGTKPVAESTYPNLDAAAEPLPASVAEVHPLAIH